MTARTNPDFNQPIEAQKAAVGYAAIDRWSIHPHFFETLKAEADAGKSYRILDIGAGSGDDAIILAKMGHQVVATEPAAAIREIGMRNTANLLVEWVDATTAELNVEALGPRSFDAVLLSAVWQYVPPIERVESLKTLAQLSKPEAILRFQFPSPPSRMGQEIISAKQFREEVSLANQALPPSMQLQLDGDPMITKDSRDRIGIDGTPVYFLEFTLRSPSRASCVSQGSAPDISR